MQEKRDGNYQNNELPPLFLYISSLLFSKQTIVIACKVLISIHHFFLYQRIDVAEFVDTLEGDEKTGAKVILKALEAPLYYIAANAGLEGAVIINKVKESAPGTGFNAATEEYVDMVDNGILDPVKVTRSALQNATSVASTLLTTESAVATIKEDTPAMPAGAGAGMGMM